MNQRHDYPMSACCDPLGPWPLSAVQALADLGMDDLEIARYFRVGADQIRYIRRTEAVRPRVSGASQARRMQTTAGAQSLISM